MTFRRQPSSSFPLLQPLSPLLLLLLPCCFFYLFLIIVSPFVGASSSSSSYNAYHYDVAAPLFTPDGRLLQVEYASKAASHSSPLVVLEITTRTSDDDDVTTLLVVMTTTATTSFPPSQDRLVVLGKNNRNKNGVLLCMSGVLADNLALLHIVQSKMQQELRWFGSASTFSAQKIATFVGDACQHHAFGGGIRPYGSTMVVCGCGLDGSSIYQTDPSGAVVRVVVQRSNNNNMKKKKTDESSTAPTLLLVVGGSETQKAQVKSEIQKTGVLSENGNEAAMDLNETLVQVAKVLLKLDMRDDDGGSSGSIRNSKHTEERRQWLEVAVLSPTHGLHRLTNSQIESLLQAVDTKR